MKLSEIFIIVEHYDGLKRKHHVYLSRKEYEKGVKHHSNSAGRHNNLVGRRASTLEFFEGTVSGFKKVSAPKGKS